MSYLDFPRIHFAGGFTAGPSTINNTPDNYKPAVTNVTPGWNPGGNGKFNIQDSQVQSVSTAPGQADSDALIKQMVETTQNWGGTGSAAKIVDLDPEQQMVSMLYGVELKIGDGDNYVIAEMEPMWFQNFLDQHHSYASYQSVLKPVEWGNNLSGVLKTLKDNSPDLLSIKFMIGPPSVGSNTAMQGNIYGTVGPANAAEPINYVPARLLRPLSSQYNVIPAQVTEGRDGLPSLLTLDLGSNVSMASAGMLDVYVDTHKSGLIKLGEIDYFNDSTKQFAAIFDIDLTKLDATTRQFINQFPIKLRYQASNPGTFVSAESESGIYVNTTPYVLRMEADSTATVNFHATKFGKPAVTEIQILDQSSTMLPRGASAPPAVGRVAPGGTEVGWIDPGTNKHTDYPAVITSDAKGKASLVISGGNPMDFRQHIDGQVYALNFDTVEPSSVPVSNNFLSLLVHDAFDKEPTWENIQPIMAQYQKLYPIMASIGIELGNKESLIKHKRALLTVFSGPFNSPIYMPVVRDLSDAKLDKIIAWLNAQPDAS